MPSPAPETRKAGRPLSPLPPTQFLWGNSWTLPLSEGQGQLPALRARLQLRMQDLKLPDLGNIA